MTERDAGEPIEPASSGPGTTEPDATEHEPLDDAVEVEPIDDRPRPVRRRVVGPFSLRQVTMAIVAVMATATVLTLATVPIGTITPGLPIPEPSAFLIGSPVPGLRIGDLAPELAVDGPEGRVELKDLNGSPIRLADLRGKAVWINFWASWCPPCQFETPTVRAMDQRYRDRGLVIVAVQVQQTVDAGIDYARRYELEYTIGADVTGSIFHAYRGFALPTQFFIDTEGRIRQIVLGPLDEPRAVQLIESILPPAPSGQSPAPSRSPAPSGSPVSSPP